MQFMGVKSPLTIITCPSLVLNSGNESTRKVAGMSLSYMNRSKPGNAWGALSGDGTAQAFTQRPRNWSAERWPAGSVRSITSRSIISSRLSSCPLLPTSTDVRG
jgi:hypothetical protein